MKQPFLLYILPALLYRNYSIITIISEFYYRQKIVAYEIINLITHLFLSTNYAVGIRKQPNQIRFDSYSHNIPNINGTAPKPGSTSITSETIKRGPALNMPQWSVS